MKLSEETRVKLDELQEEYNKAAYEVLLQEAKNNNPYDVGDTLETHCEIGRVMAARVAISVHSRSYEISYICDRLNKKLRPYRGGELTKICLSNVKAKL